MATPNQQDARLAILVKILSSLNNVNGGAVSSPSFFPEGSEPKKLDTEWKILQKILGAVNSLESGGGGGGSIYPQLFSTDANTLEVYNGEYRQSFNLYGYRLDAENYERLSFNAARQDSRAFYVIAAEIAGDATSDHNIVISPLGGGAFSLRMPRPGTVFGYQAVDLGSERSSDSEIASGDYSFRAGANTVASGLGTFSTGEGTQATADDAFACNFASIASGNISWAGGNRGYADKDCQFAFGGGAGQFSEIPVTANTTDATPQELRTPSMGSGCTIPENTAWRFEISVVARTDDNTDFATYKRYGLCYRAVGAGTSALVGAVLTEGVDIASAGAATWSVAVTVDGTNDYLKVVATGAADQNIYWFAKISLTEVNVPR